MGLPVRNVDVCRYVSPQIKERVQLDGLPGLTEPGPWKEGQSQVDGGGFRCIDGAVDVQPVALLAVQASLFCDQVLCERIIEPPVSDVVGIGERVSGNAATNTHVVELARLGANRPRYHAGLSDRSVGQTPYTDIDRRN